MHYNLLFRMKKLLNKNLYKHCITIWRTHRLEVFRNKGVLKNSAMFTGKHFCRSKLQVAGQQLYQQKREPHTSAFLRI